MKKILYYTFLFINFIAITTAAQVKQFQSPIFTLRAAPNEPMPDSIQVAFNKGIISPLHAEIVKIKKNKDGSFDFSFSTEQAISSFSLWIYYPTNRNKSRKEIFSTVNYYAEPSDRIEISVVKGNPIGALKIDGKLTFKGKGAEKYEVVTRLKQMKNDLHLEETNNMYKVFGKGGAGSTGKIESEDYYKSTEFKYHLNALFENVKKGVKKSQDTIFKHEKAIGKDIAAFYIHQFTTPLTFVNIVHWLYRRSKTANTKQAIADFYFAHIDSIRRSVPNDVGFNFGQEYAWFKSNELMYELDYYTKGMGYPLEVQYNALKKIENANLRDILVTKFFEEAGYFQVYINNSSLKDSCLIDALKFVKEPELRAALKHQRLFAKGVKIPNFSFPDTSGMEVSLRDLKGKVYILDFYFDGCAACVVFTKRFEREIYPEFANNTDFKTLSVNTDLRRERWLSAIKSGKYTHPNSINLSTGPTGYHHPILKYYGINAFPWVLLVNKKGEILAFNVHAQSSQDLIRMIKEALNENYTESEIGNS